MLGEGFLRILRYREERKFASKSEHTEAHDVDVVCSDLDSTVANEGQVSSAETDPGPPQIDPLHHKNTPGLLIPGRLVNLAPDPVLVDVDDCSLLVHYPDLQVADSGCIPHPHSKITTPKLQLPPAIHAPAQLDPVPDQGYLVMNSSVNISMDVPGLEPMSNSVLNGMLEKKLEEVYMQHLTENLARCNSNFGNSLLHGLVPPPQQNRQGVDSLVDSMDSTSSEKPISYLSTNNAPCSSNFSSPVLRISEGENQD